MEYRTFSYKVRMKIEFIRYELDVITRCALAHHDIQYKAVAVEGGILYGMQNQIALDDRASGRSYDPDTKFLTVLSLDEISIFYEIMKTNKSTFQNNR